MTLQSLTGFARTEGRDEAAGWAWEIRSLNGRALDMRCRLPPGAEKLEPALRACTARTLKRGNVQITLTLDRASAEGLPVLNEAGLERALAITEEIAARTGFKPPDIASLLTVRGVLGEAEGAGAQGSEEGRERALLESYQTALEMLVAARQVEGAAIGRALAGRIDEIERIVKKITEDPSRRPEAIRQRLSEQVSRLIDGMEGIDPDRLYQEAAILATKADLHEEIDRLDAHVDAARALLSGGGAVGRKLDFLAQEFNRECNTICSKSNAASVTAAGLDLKVVIDQFREQVQNLE